MTNTDKPDLPELPAYSLPGDHPPISHVVSLREAIEYAEACRADERRKARAELIAEIRQRLTGRAVAGALLVDDALALIADTKENHE